MKNTLKSIRNGIFANYLPTDPVELIAFSARNLILFIGSIDMCWTNFTGEYASEIRNDSKTTKFSEWYVKRTWEPEVRGDEYWGT